jgi:hypothetical protein
MSFAPISTRSEAAERKEKLVWMRRRINTLTHILSLHALADSEPEEAVQCFMGSGHRSQLR